MSRDYLAMLQSGARLCRTDRTDKTPSVSFVSPHVAREMTSVSFVSSGIARKNSFSGGCAEAVEVSALCWRVCFADHETTIATSGVTRADIMTMYPDAISVETYQPPVSAPPTAAMTDEEESALRAWLALIGETNHEAIAEVVLKCQHDADARRYFIGRAKSDCSTDKVFSTQRSK